jgi:transcriptional regulator
MYVPAHFREDDADTLAALMAAHSFALLVTVDTAGLPFATHQPLLYERDGGPHGRLLGHIARANPQWRHFASGKPALAVFQGPHAYISPSWYQVRPAVPTWNYAAVHAYGTPRIIDDQAAVRRLLERLVRTYESGQPAPWSLGHEPETFLASMQRAIVAFEIPVERLEGKWKMSQNRQPVDRERSIAALRHAGGAGNLATADVMAALLADEGR